ncbi:MAG: EAL domain-containing protein [Acholeplasmatales bacterium]|nr:EAL domain-containing protein [Acholeplasmatales bacterium]
MEFNEIIEKILYLHNELIFVIDIKSKQIFDVYKGKNKIKDKTTIDEFIDIFVDHYDLIDNFRFKLSKFLINLDPPKESFELSIVYTKKDESSINIKYKALPLDDEKVLFSISNNSEEMSSTFDDLTKCYTSNVLYDKIDKSIKDKKEFALMKIDIDSFKSFNEIYGHMFGDMILIEVAGIIKAFLGNNGYVARIGGDDFLVLVYTTNDYDTVHELCASLRIKISNLDGSNCVKNAKFTATMGCALYPKDGDTLNTLIKKVDSALLRGKNKGKNCFIMYTEEKCGKINLNDDLIIVKDKDIYNSSITNYNIIYGIIEVLNRKSYIKTNFIDSLSLLGNYFMLDRISLIVLNPETGKFDDQIIWNNPLYPVVPLISNPDNISNWRKTYDTLKMIKINQVASNSDLAIYDQISKEKTSALLAFELIHEDKVYGQVRFDMIHKNRFWQPKNVRALALISKMYAIKLAAEYTSVKHYKELYVDELTGLFNYSKWLIDAHDFTIKNNQKYSIIVFEICDFVSLMCTIGSKKCDQIIIKISEWLKNQKEDITCRVRGEMFAILTKDSDFDSLKERANHFYRYVTQLGYNNSSYSSVRIKSGVYIANEYDGIDVSMERAFLALNSSHNNDIILYTDKLYDDIKEQTALELHIEEALEKNEFMLYIQPKISTKTGKIGGAEALTRWNYKFEKILQPYKFIPLFERTGYITKLDYNVFENVCIFLRSIIDLGKKAVPISVNVSRYTVDFDNYINTINSIRNKYNIPIELLELEITEGMYTENMDDISEFVNKLRKEGYAISIDDFGSGYSNLNNIANLDFEVLKLDKSLCNMNNNRKEIILDAIISIAKKAGHKIVCEGVEDKEMYEKLAKLGADYIQ